MGQQQLLLLIIGVVLVGLAIVAGFFVFETKSDQFAADNLLNRSLTIASEAVFWKTKMDPYNGGNAKYIGLIDNGMTQLALQADTHDGRFQITSATDDELEITGVSKRNPKIGVRVFVVGYDIINSDIAYDGSITLDEPVDQ